MRRLTLRSKLYILVGVVAVSLLVIGRFLLWSLPHGLDAMLTHWEIQRAEAVAALVETQVRPRLASLLQSDDRADAFELLDALSEVRYAWVASPDGHIWGQWHLQNAPTDVASQISHVGVSWHADHVRIVRDIEQDGSIVASLVVGLRFSEQTKFRALVAGKGYWFAVLSLPLILFVVVYIVQQLLQPILQLHHRAKYVAQSGDMNFGMHLQRHDELGALASYINSLIQQQRQLLGRISAMFMGISEVDEASGAYGKFCAQNFEQVQSFFQTDVEQTSQRLHTFELVEQKLQHVLHQEEAQRRLAAQIGDKNKIIQKDLDAISKSTDSTVAYSENMARAVADISHGVFSLNNTLTQTASAMSMMAKAIVEIENNSKKTAELSEQAVADAEIGVQALQKTLEGIANIKDASLSTNDVISRLGSRIDEIGAILRVIDDVAAQTKMLSLNAAIIASQAGEHGRGFSVVADQIKGLAQRTNASTREIASLIEAVQQESRKAASAMALGIHSVNHGLELGHEAAAVLEKIRQSAGAASKMIYQIIGAAVSQSRNGAQISESIDRVNTFVSQLTEYTQQQTTQTAQLGAQGAEALRAMALARHAVEEHAGHTEQVGQSIEATQKLLEELLALQHAQKQETQKKRQQLEHVQGLFRAQSNQVGDLQQAIATLSLSSRDVQAETSKFNV